MGQLPAATWAATLLKGELLAQLTGWLKFVGPTTLNHNFSSLLVVKIELESAKSLF